jgi:hypothetical protein
MENFQMGSARESNETFDSLERQTERFLRFFSESTQEIELPMKQNRFKNRRAVPNCLIPQIAVVQIPVFYLPEVSLISSCLG